MGAIILAAIENASMIQAGAEAVINLFRKKAAEPGPDGATPIVPAADVAAAIARGRAAAAKVIETADGILGRLDAEGK